MTCRGWRRSRLSARLESDLAAATAALQQCLEENHELRAQVAELVEHRMQEQGWLVSSGTAEALYAALRSIEQDYSCTSSISVPKLPFG